MDKRSSGSSEIWFLFLLSENLRKLLRLKFIVCSVLFQFFRFSSFHFLKERQTPPLHGQSVKVTRTSKMDFKDQIYQQGHFVETLKLNNFVFDFSTVRIHRCF